MSIKSNEIRKGENGMTKAKVQQMAFEMVAAAGDAFDCFYKAVLSYKKNELGDANELFLEGKKHLQATHLIQTEMVQAEAMEEEIPYSIIMVHAQDHLTLAICWKRMAEILLSDV